ncbi:pilus assembly protein PilY [Myxococcus sp. RHSTA-1-4]|uniref:pilus assembly protein PilY n=1 Tax=Myxococcus sp. RHSTA-1-4 TaxID=2874601 RepID=UPI001CC1B834|nr:pilus assembly protein PilY [Myxococcus sp. RHSTA-1-4]MBZ4415266.1 pilus assembly protein PilY [Myxococcus sp. RHSTA-1-4]
MLRTCRLLIAAMVFAIPLAATAQDGGTSFNPCIDTTGDDQQPDFTEEMGARSAIDVTKEGWLRLNTFHSSLNPERIVLPFEQDLEALIVDDRAGEGASHTLGWFYYDDLVNRGYVDIRDPLNNNDDVLIDSDGNGVPDFHEDLYNLNANRPYIGSEGPRCPSRTFTHPKPDGGTATQFREPDLLTGSCGSDPSYDPDEGPRRWPDDDWYPDKPNGGVVGMRVVDTSLDISSNGPDFNRTDTYFSDRGLFPHIPNLLEPRAEENNNLGLGNIVFYATDDDGNSCPGSDTAECLQPRMGYTLVNGVKVPAGPLWDRRGAYDGLPDYKASAFDTQGRLIPGKSPTAPINEEDRRVKVGRIQGEREIVFFLVTYVEQIYGRLGGEQATDSCFMVKPEDGRVQCTLWAHGDINVFFSKTLLNMDLHQVGEGSPPGDTELVAEKTLQSGWLDFGAYTRLGSDTYGNVTFPADQPIQQVRSYGYRAAHTLVGAPYNNPNVWILGWEDQNSGGNRTYNDIVILINKQNNGTFKSDIVSDISPDIALDYTITSVEMTINDQPYNNIDGQPSDCSPDLDIPLPDGGTEQPRPKITYQVALDCQVCTADCGTATPTFSPNPEPGWVTMPFPAATATPGTRVDITRSVSDFLERGYTGSQLCWRAIIESPGESCQPIIKNVNVSYKAQKSGQYGRASILPVANTILFGQSETPGRTWYTPRPWYENPAPASPNVLYPSYRVYDRRLDVSERGHVYLRRLYEPENPAHENTAADNWDTWNGGERLSHHVRTDTPDTRLLLSTNPNNATPARATVASLAGETLNISPLFPTSTTAPNNETLNLCAPSLAGRYDLNQDGVCNANDRNTLRNWLYGWEYNQYTTIPAGLPAEQLPTRRTWPMGGINLSTAAIVGPASEPSWLKRAPSSEQDAFRAATFLNHPTLQNRQAVAFIGSTTGYLHALSLGKVRSGDDNCTAFKEFRGYFAHAVSPGCAPERDYGTGEELYAYLPGKMLRYYVENYIRSQDKTRRATVDAAPSVAFVDLRNSTEYLPTTGYNPASGTPWVLNTTPGAREGAKTVLVSATGPSQSVFFSLDVTNPADTTNYPGIMWELDVQRDRFYESGANQGALCSPTATDSACKTLERIFPSDMKPDTGGSRHNPVLVRMDFGTAGGKKWVAAFASDYSPKVYDHDNNAATPPQASRGTLYLIDVKTGVPIQVNHGTSKLKNLLAGVVVLGDVGEGIGSAPVSVDVDGDSNYDVVYVATTRGRVFRVNLRNVDTSSAASKLGKVISSCVIANAREARDPANGNNLVQDAAAQSIYSNIAVKQDRNGASSAVRIFFGTGNNPDDDTEAVDQGARPRYHLMAFDDPNPLTDTSCTQGSVAWVQPLDPRQVVWGGVTLGDDDTVYTATAVGTSANLCSLDADESGMLYAFGAVSGGVAGGNGTSLGGHSLTQPVSFDRRIFVQANTTGITNNRPGQAFNTESGSGNGTRSRTIIWDVRPGGNIQGVIP